MLTYFPTPYPDELWYSVLCRYYVRSGFAEQWTIKTKLFHGVYVLLGCFYPNNTYAQLINEALNGLYNLEDVLLQNSLLPYYLRFFNPEKKNYYLQGLLQGQSKRTNNISSTCADGRQGLKFCPLCYEEDVAQYGEPYWHREHQIPLMPLCHKHRCRLELFPKLWTHLNRRFYPICMITPSSPNFQSEQWEGALTDMLFDLLTLPFSVGITPEYSNLHNALLECGYGSKQRRHHETLNAKSVYDASTSFFGDNIVKYYFPQYCLDISSRLESWSFAAPEIYALLSVLGGISAAELFGPPIVRRSSVELPSSRNYVMTVTLTAEEKRLLKDAAAKNGQSLAGYVRQVMFQRITP